jgi:RimJ/RimL family protein N-acetyltransferase
VPEEDGPPVLRTARLRLVPLDADSMRLLAEDWSGLQGRLGARPSPPWIVDPRALDAAQRHRAAMLRDPGSWLWWTFWQIVLVAERTSVGMIDFKGPPGMAGVVTLGVSLAPARRGVGYATEATRALVTWAFRQPGVRAIEAETAAGNARAHRVLGKLGFAPAGRIVAGMAGHGDGGDLLAWRLLRPGGERPAGPPRA